MISVRRRTICLTLAALLALTVCTGAALAYCQPEAASAAAAGVDPLYCGGRGHHGGGRGGHHGGGGHGCHGTQTTAAEPAYPWLFCPSKGCVDTGCTRTDHFHYCSALCADPEHEHYCELEGTEFPCGESWHRSGCAHANTVVYSKGCTDDHHDCTAAGHYHHCSVDCTNPAHEHFTVCRYADGSVEMVMKTA